MLEDRSDPHAYIQRAVFVGLGGSGAEVIRRLRRLVVNRYGSLAALPIVRFLCIETDERCIDTLSRELNEDIRFSTEELLDASISDLPKLCEDVERRQPVDLNWLATSQLKDIKNVKRGTNGIRQLGRLCFHIHRGAIEELLTRIVLDVNSVHHADAMWEQYRCRVEPGLNIHIVCSLAGGTGSGAMFDLAYLARKVMRQIQIQGPHQCIGYLFLPSGFRDVTDTASFPGAYATLSELNALSLRHFPAEGQPAPLRLEQCALSKVYGSEHEATPPFDPCYILDISNDRVQLHRDDVYAVAANMLFCEMDPVLFPLRRTMRTEIQPRLTDDDALGCPTQFMSFGQSSVRFPVQAARQLLIHQLALRAIQRWLDPYGNPVAILSLPDSLGSQDDVVNAAKATLSEAAANSARLAEVNGYLAHDFLRQVGISTQELVSRIISGDTPATEIPYRLRDAECQRWDEEGLPREDVLNILSAMWSSWQAEFCDTNASKLCRPPFDKMQQNQDAALSSLYAAISERCWQLFHDADHGPAFSLCFVRQTCALLNRLAKVLSCDASNPSKIAQAIGDLSLMSACEKGSGEELAGLIEQRARQEFEDVEELASQNWLAYQFGGSNRLRSQAAEYLTWRAHTCRYHIEILARSLATELCNNLLQALQKIEQQIITTICLLATVQAKLTDASREWVRRALEQSNVGIDLFNGVILDVLEQKLAVHRGPTYSPDAVRARALQTVGINFDTLGEADGNRLGDALLYAAEEALGDLKENELANTDFAAHDLLVALHAGPAALQAVLDDVLAKGAPLLRFTEYPSGGKWEDGGQYPNGPLIARKVAILDGFPEDDPDPERAKVAKTLDQLGWDIRREGFPINVSDRILFFQEIGGFPLRAVGCINELKEAYDRYRYGPHSIPLHTITKALVALLPDIFSPSPEEIKRAFLLQTTAVVFKDYRSANVTRSSHGSVSPANLCILAIPWHPKQGDPTRRYSSRCPCPVSW